MDVKGAVSGASAFIELHQAAESSLYRAHTPISADELPALKDAWNDAHSSMAFLNGQSAIRDYLSTRDPALLATLEASGNYERYGDELWKRAGRGQSMPQRAIEQDPQQTLVNDLKPEISDAIRRARNSAAEVMGWPAPGQIDRNFYSLYLGALEKDGGAQELRSRLSSEGLDPDKVFASIAKSIPMGD